jgi:hypothetical protein
MIFEPFYYSIALYTFLFLVYEFSLFSGLTGAGMFFVCHHIPAMLSTATVLFYSKTDPFYRTPATEAPVSITDLRIFTFCSFYVGRQ